MILLVFAAIAAVLLILALVFVYECVTAPTVDEHGYLIADPYGRCGPAFRQGEPVPPEHEGKRYGG